MLTEQIIRNMGDKRLLSYYNSIRFDAEVSKRIVKDVGLFGMFMYSINKDTKSPKMINVNLEEIKYVDLVKKIIIQRRNKFRKNHLKV